MDEFSEEFLEFYTKEDLEIVNNYIDSAFDEKYSNDDWECSFDIEKIHAIQEVYHFTFTKDGHDDNPVCLSLAQGVDNCDVVDYSLHGISEVDRPLMQEILSDVVMDKERIENFLHEKNATSKINWNLVEMIFKGKKEQILDIYKKQGYDDYVTGGGTTKTDDHYGKAFDDLKKQGIFWTCVYKTIEVDRNIR